jgi:hypothetical protein
MLTIFFIILECLIILLLENYLKLLYNLLMMSLNKWNQREIYLELFFPCYVLNYGSSFEINGNFV